MSDNTIFEELKTYGEKFGNVLQCLSQQGIDSEPGPEKKQENSSRELVFQYNKLSLYHYLPLNISKLESKKLIKTPVLIVYALVNRPTILDLEKKHSAIAKMLENDLDVYLIDWGYPDRADNKLTLNDYINKQLDSCVDHICKSHSVNAINLLGVCQGGVLSLCYSSLNSERIKNLVTIVTPVDFQTEDDLLSQWVKHIDIDLMVDTLGNIPGGMLSNTFLSLKPYQLQLKKYLDLINSVDCENKQNINQDRVSNFISMEQWIFDSPDQAGETFRHYVKSCYQQNKLIKGEFEIGGRIIDLKTLKMPVLNVYAEKDHLVPPAASKALKSALDNTEYEELPVTGGHIGIFVSKKTLNTTFPAIADWFRTRD